MDTKALRHKILDLAIHGRLVPQDPSDEPASVLLSRINTKAEIYCDNKQYGNLPKGWCFVSGKNLYKPMKSIKPKGATFKYIDIDSIDNTKQKIGRLKIIRTENAPSRASRYTQKGDIVFSMVRPYLKNIAIVTSDECIASTGFYICSPSDVAISKYCYYLMTSDYVVNGLNQFMKGDNSPSINKRDIENWLLPLPPLKEQERIVAEIERWFSLIDSIDRGKETLADAIRQAKSKILDLAIHGKLVPQDPNDEPASALLKRVKPNAQTTSDTPPYGKLPRGWCVTTMQMLCSLVDGEKQNGVERINLDVKYLRGEHEAKFLISGMYVKKNALLILVDGENSGEVFRTPTEGYQGSTFKQLAINVNMNIDYILQVINIQRKALRENKVGSAIPHLNKKMFKAIEVPIPPYNEQQRIVNAINEAFSALDRISDSL